MVQAFQADVKKGWSLFIGEYSFLCVLFTVYSPTNKLICIGMVNAKMFYGGMVLFS